MLDCTVQVTAGSTVASGRMRAGGGERREIRGGVAEERRRQADDVQDDGAVHARTRSNASAAQDRVAGEGVGSAGALVEREPAALREERDGIPPADGLDGVVGDPLRHA